MVAAIKRVLVVDDEAIVRESYKLALTDAGYAVDTVASGREAIQACHEERYDVMLADIRMPDMDGVEVARVISREFPDVRVVLITGYPSAETQEQASRIGVMDYLQKPLRPDRLSEATASALNRPRIRVPLVASAQQTEPTVKETAPMSTMQAAFPGMVPVAKKDVSAVTAALLLASSPLIGFLYYLLFPFVAVGVAIGVVVSEIAKSLRGE
jgi:DNA-binding NtrC family response regulator